MRQHSYSQSKAFKRIAFGFVLVVVGILFMLRKMNFIDPAVEHWLFTWQMLLIAIGFVNLFSRDSYVAGLILIMIGTFFLVPEVLTIPFNFAAMFWPLLLVGAGVLMILKHSIGSSKSTSKCCYNGMQEKETTLNDDGFLEDFNLFGGTKRRINSVFKGGKFVNVFGGSELDLSQATLGDNVAIIEVICVFGGVTFKIPSDWEVQVEVVPVLGGFSDKRSYVRTSIVEPRKKLIIKGVCVFGGGEIKDL